MAGVQRQQKRIKYQRERQVENGEIAPCRIANIPLYARVILIAMPCPGTVRLIMLPQPLSSSAMAMIGSIRIHILVFQIKIPASLPVFSLTYGLFRFQRQRVKRQLLIGVHP